MRTISDLAHGRDNHFNLIRLLAASAVLVSHSYPLTLGRGAVEPLDAWTGHSLGACAVFIFFGISGFMITASFERRHDLAAFGAARVARIFPGLLVALALTAFVLGPAVSDLSPLAYLTDPATLTYLPRNLSLKFLQYELPGVFSSNPYGGAVNGSLWTLFWEVSCYVMVVIAGLAGLLRPSRFGGALAAYLAVLAVLIWRGTDSSAVELSLPFVIGMALHVYRERIVLGWWSLAIALLFAALTYPTPLWLMGYATALTFGAIWLGFAKAPLLLPFNRIGDFSYGTYIYAFPVQQAVAWYFPGIDALQMIAVALPVTLGLAALSWWLIEEPALARRERLASVFRRLLLRNPLPAS